MVRLRRVISAVLALVGAAAIVVGIVAGVAERSLFDPNRVEATTGVIVTDRDVARLLTREITDRVVELADLQDQRTLVEPFVADALATDEVRTEVVDAVMASYEELMHGSADTIVFNLDTIATQVRGQAVALVPSLDRTLPPADELLRFELFHRADLPWVFDVIDTVRAIAWWVLVLGAVMVATALVLGPSRFAMFGLAAAATVVGMFLLSTWITSASGKAIDGIDDQLTRRVARVATDKYLSDLDHVAIGVVIFGIIAVIVGVGGSWIVNAVRPPRPRAVKS